MAETRDLDALISQYGGKPVQQASDMDALIRQYGGQVVPPPAQSRGALGPMSDVIGVINERLVPYAAAAAGGGVVGGPVGAAVGPLALGLADLGAAGFNVGAQALGSERRAPLASDVIRGAARQAFPSAFREPQTSAQQYIATGAEALASTASQVNALRKLAAQMGPGAARNVLTELGSQPVVQAGAAVPAAITPQVVMDLTDEGAVLRDPYAMGALSVLAGAAGGAATAKATRAGRIAAPTLDKMRAQAGATYRAVEQQGVQFEPNAYATFLSGLRNKLDGFDPDQHKAVDLEIRNLEKSIGQARTISELDAARSNIRKRLGKSTDPNIRRLGEELADELDDFVLNSPLTAVQGGNYPQATALLTDARRQYAAVSKSERMEELVRRAKLSDQPLDDAIRTEFRNVARNERRFRMYTPEEQAVITEVVQGGKLAAALTSLSESLRVRSTLGGGLYAGSTLGIFAPQVPPEVALTVGIGTAGARAATRAAAERAALSRAGGASEFMRGGRPAAIAPRPIGAGIAAGLNALAPTDQDFNFLAEQQRLREIEQRRQLLGF